MREDVVDEEQAESENKVLDGSACLRRVEIVDAVPRSAICREAGWKEVVLRLHENECQG